ncbi:MAG: putative bifunctional diguanylate cyclase/phosphodiesterase [Geminicoccaceae bacterium]
MKRLIRVGYYGLLAMALGIFAFSIAHTLHDIRLGQSSVVKVTALNYWNISQARLELERTTSALDSYVGENGRVAKDDLIDRFDIFWSRLPILIEGSQSHGIVELTDAEVIIPGIIASMKEIEPQILSLVSNAGDEYFEIRDVLLSFAPLLQRIYLDLHHTSETGFSSLTYEMADLYARHVVYLIGALVCGLILILMLFSEMHRALRARRMAHDARVELETVINAMPLSIDAVDREHRLTLCNDYGCKAHMIDIRSKENQHHPVGCPFPMLEHLNQKILESGEAPSPVEVNCNQPDTDDRIWLVSKQPVVDSAGKVKKVVTVGVDITERKNTEAKIKRMAQHDALTDLPNRNLFRRRLASALVRANKNRTIVAILYIDLDSFKAINDELGHEAGDHFLIHAAHLMRSCLRPCDTLARLGGDEFAIIREDIGDAHETDLLAERIAAAFAEPADIDGQRWYSTISLGISQSPRDGTEPSELLRHADFALYAAKAAGGNTWRFFSRRMQTRQHYQHELQQDLRHAIANNELTLHYQPKVRLSDQRLCGFEALLRWNHPKHGLIPPSDFIPIAETCDLILKLGQFVLHKACVQMIAWQNEGIDPPPIAINLSAAQFAREPVATMVLQTLEETGLRPDLLELEVTESILLAKSDTVLEALNTLRALNIGISLDDFGTGYSSLSYLQRFPINKIKIDKSFVQSISQENGGDLAIVRAIIAMAHSLDMKVVAEGVETEVQYSTLENMGCDEIQGFYLSRAEPAEQLDRWLRFDSIPVDTRRLSNRRQHLKVVSREP